MGVPAGSADAAADTVQQIAGIKRQVEYYFSDANLPRDRFLLAKIDENEEGWVDIAVLLTFNKMKELNATIELVCTALGACDFLEINKESTRIRRTTPVPDASEVVAKTMYAKGWVATDPEPEPAEVSKLFAPYGSVQSVRMRRWKADDGSRHFKGSVFVDFDSAEAVERATAETHLIKVRDKESGELVDKELVVMSVDEYSAKKKLEAKERTRMYKERKAAKKAAAQAGSDGTANGAQKPPVKREFVKGLVLRFAEVPDSISREDLKEAFQDCGDIAWVDFERGQTEGHIRFALAEGAAAAVGALKSGSVKLNESAFTGSLLTGDEETQYWEKVWEAQGKAKQSKKRSREHGGRNGGHKRQRGGRGGRG